MITFTFGDTKEKENAITDGSPWDYADVVDLSKFTVMEEKEEAS